MSEFKVGDQIVKTSPKIRYAHIRTVIAVTKSGGAVLDYCGYGYKYPSVRHATPEEITAGHRIDFPTLPKPVGSLQELHPEFAKVLHENFLELISDDPHTENRIGRIDKPSNPRELETLDKPENHISPMCKSKDV